MSHKKIISVKFLQEDVFPSKTPLLIIPEIVLQKKSKLFPLLSNAEITETELNPSTPFQITTRSKLPRIWDDADELTSSLI